MSDLDKHVAEAQGWRVEPSGLIAMADSTYAYLLESSIDEYKDMGIGNLKPYTPSTDLNQAIAFAEWMLATLSNDTQTLELMLSLSLNNNRDLIGYVAVYNITTQRDIVQTAIDDGLIAEAICQAALTALKGKL